MNRLRIIFIGTPDFAVASLQALIANNYNVVAVVTAVDKPAGRGMQIQKSEVKLFAEQQGIDILQPPNLKDETFLKTLQAYQADLQIVVAFRMLSQLVWAMPRLGTINVHGSLLPNYRGAAPIHWAVMNGEIETGVTTFRLRHEIDTGNILLQKKVLIASEDTTGSMYEKLKIEGAHLLIATMELIVKNNDYAGEEQDKSQSINWQHAPKILPQHGVIDWHNEGKKIVNQIRGLSPMPGAYTVVANKKLKIFKAFFEEQSHHHEHGKFFIDAKTELKFACKNGFIHIRELQLEGKKKMNTTDFLRGNTILQ